MNGLGTLHEQGQGVPRNLAEAERWYAMAAAKGNKTAAANLERLRKASKKRR
jgi:TPR repeat protein